MSCGCSNNINYPSGCGSSSCNSCNSCASVGCEQVIYTGPNLLCAGIDNKDNLCVALQKLDDAICNVPIASITASNGLYKNGNDIRMGGALIEPTIISTSTTYPLSLTGLATDPSPLYVLVQTNLGVVRKSLVSTITSSILALLTADNGLTYTSTNVQLGGPLIQPTTISTGVSNTLSITGLVITSSPTYILTETNTGVVQMTTTSTFISGILSQITANNGLTKTSNNIQLGGSLVQNTTVDLATYKLTLKDSGAAPTGLEIVPGAAAPTNWTTSNVNILSGKIYGSGLTWLTNNVGIGIQPDDSTVNPSAPRLIVYKALSNGTTGGNFATSSLLLMGGSVTSLSSGNKYVSSYSKLEFYPGADITVSGAIDKFVSTSLSEFIFEPSGAAGDTISNGKISAIAARGYFVFDKNLDSFATIRIAPSVRDAGNGYTGTIDELIGLKIDNQRTDSNLSARITKTYGIQQNGSNDYNNFAGKTYFAENVGIGTIPLEPISAGGIGTRLFVYRALSASAGWPAGSVSQVVGTDSNLDLLCNTAQVGTVSSRYVGAIGRLGVKFGSNQVLSSPYQAYSGSFGYMQYSSRYDTTVGYLSGVAGQNYFVKDTTSGISGDVENVIGLRSMAPITDVFTGYGGVIANSIGVLIEDQRQFIDGLNPSFTGTITTSYGIKQEGQDDINLFNAIINKMPYLPVYANNVAALAGGLTVGTIYRTATGELRIVI